MNHQLILTRPPDINLPLSSDQSPPPHPWNPDHCDILDVGLANFLTVPKIGKKCVKRVDSIWGAWFFFSFYFKPVLNEKSKAKITRDRNGVSGFNKSDLQVDIFMVQHDMENMYMWVFKEKPENALGKMQLRSYMNGHSRQGERPFPFSADRGFVRSHRMQRKHYRGLSNPQCVHGVEVVPSPSLVSIDDDDRKRWMELTGRELDFTIPPEASDYGTWRNLSVTEFELERPFTQVKPNNIINNKKLLNGPVLNLSNHVNGSIDRHSPPNGNNNNNNNNKRKKDLIDVDDCYLAMNGPDRALPDLEWMNGFSGVLRDVYGPVTAAKTTYEDEKGYLILISLPFVDLQRVKVSWRNTLTHGIIKVSCTSTSRTPFIQRHNRTFKLTDASSEHCPPGTVLEILVPKLQVGPEEHEVRVCLRPHHAGNDLMLN
ncbi:hypothetical protein PHJA_002848600 [Phtheirospermum japonicum]|uniref:SLT1 protein n=1 Tax=Phtheirospermum japonicum TaxID=374723 RepID=A0A830DF15_9LAMI|nr:hypothetical protein PHJA_002848600 [Phtheirospermum japonicum]